MTKTLNSFVIQLLRMKSLSEDALFAHAARKGLERESVFLPGMALSLIDEMAA